MSNATLIASVTSGRYSSGDTLAGMTLVAYDYLLTFNKEKEFVWRSPWTPGKVLFLLVRYLPFIDLPLWPFNDGMLIENTALSCNLTEYFVLFSLLFSDLLADAVYGLRTWALWNRSRIMGILLVGTWLAMCIGLGVYIAVFQSGAPAQRVPGLPGCFIFSSPDDPTWKAYVLTAIYQFAIFLATIIKGIQHLHRAPANLVTVLYRDAFLASLGQLCISLTNITILRATHQPNWGLNATFRALTSILPSRIILNIREAATSVDGWDVTFVSDESSLPTGSSVEEHELSSTRRA